MPLSPFFANTETIMPAFSFYSDVVPLDSNKHRTLRFQAVTDFSFTRKTQSVAIGAGEFFDCAVEYPIVFVRSPSGLVPVALFGAQPEQNLFVDADGRWDANYRPLFVQRYPFITLAEAEKRLAVGFDPACPNLSAEKGERLLDDNGQATEAFQNHIKMLDRAHGEFMRGEALAKIIDEKKLLQPMSAQISVEGGPKVELTGFEVVDVAKLDALSIGEQGLLAKTGELALIHAHLVSMRNFRKLAARFESRQPTDRR